MIAVPVCSYHLPRKSTLQIKKVYISSLFESWWCSSGAWIVLPRWGRSDQWTGAQRRSELPDFDFVLLFPHPVRGMPGAAARQFCDVLDWGASFEWRRNGLRTQVHYFFLSNYFMTCIMLFSNYKAIDDVCSQEKFSTIWGNIKRKKKLPII